MKVSNQNKSPIYPILQSLINIHKYTAKIGHASSTNLNSDSEQTPVTLNNVTAICNQSTGLTAKVKNIASLTTGK